MVDSNAEETKIYISLYIEDEFESLLVFELDCLTVLFIQSIIFAHFLSLFSLPHECFNVLSHLQGDKMFHWYHYKTGSLFTHLGELRCIRGMDAVSKEK